MKSYTDIEQSKKLTDILPIESADMYYQYVLPKSDKIRYNPIFGNPIDALEWYNKGYTHFGKKPLTLNEYCIPCWSLTALLAVLPNYTLQTNMDGTVFVVCESKKPMISNAYNNPVDACIAMIEELHEQKFL